MTTRLVGVEVFKGATSTRYGPQTVGGAVNVLTRSIPTKKEWTGDLSYGAFNTLKLHGYTGGGLENGVYYSKGRICNQMALKSCPLMPQRDSPEQSP